MSLINRMLTEETYFEFQAEVEPSFDLNSQEELAIFGHTSVSVGRKTLVGLKWNARVYPRRDRIMVEPQLLTQSFSLNFTYEDENGDEVEDFLEFQVAEEDFEVEIESPNDTRGWHSLELDPLEIVFEAKDTGAAPRSPLASPDTPVGLRAKVTFSAR